jgi:hypothetical protein
MRRRGICGDVFDLGLPDVAPQPHRCRQSAPRRPPRPGPKAEIARGCNARQRAGDGAARRVRIFIRGPEKRTGAGAGAENGRAGGLLIQLALIVGERLAGGQVGLEGGCGRAVEDRRAICTAITAGSDKNGQKSKRNRDGFHWVYLDTRGEGVQTPSTRVWCPVISVNAAV